MAEFAEVMRQWVRVRKATASSAEENVLSVYPLERYDDAMIAVLRKTSCNGPQNTRIRFIRRGENGL